MTAGRAPAPESFAVALAKIDVQVSDRRDDGTAVYEVIGKRELEAAHRAEVERAVADALAAERDEIALRFAIAVVTRGSQMEDGKVNPRVMPHSYTYADAFLAERTRQRGGG